MMQCFTLNNWAKFKSQLPAVLSKEDFAFTKVPFDMGVMNGAFDSNLTAQLPEGVKFGRLADFSEAELEPFAVSLLAQAPQLFAMHQEQNIYILSIFGCPKLDTPIQLFFSNTQNAAVSLFVHVAEGAEATLIEEFGSASGAVFYNQQVHAEAGSKLRVVSVQELPDTAHLFEFRHSYLGEGANVELFNAQFGAKAVYSKTTQESVGNASEMNTDLVCRVQGSQHYDFDFANVFNKRNGRGVITAKGVALDKATLGMHGVLNIKQQGGGTDTHLTQAALNLSPDAKVKATPALEIDTNDVKAGHGASVQNLNEADLFYMQSRGIELEEARQMLMEGFLKEEIDKLADLPEIQERLYIMI